MAKKKSDLILWARQYSKRLLAALLIIWGVGAIIGAVYEFVRLFACPDTASMDSFYIYLAAPITCGIPSYIIPNIYLNCKKVEKNYNPNYDREVLGEREGEGIGTPLMHESAAVDLSSVGDTFKIQDAGYGNMCYNHNMTN